MVEKEVVLANPGKVAFPFRVHTESLTRASVLDVAPLNGRAPTTRPDPLYFQ